MTAETMSTQTVYPTAIMLAHMGEAYRDTQMKTHSGLKGLSINPEPNGLEGQTFVAQFGGKPETFHLG